MHLVVTQGRFPERGPPLLNFLKDRLKKIHSLIPAIFSIPKLKLYLLDVSSF